MFLSVKSFLLSFTTVSFLVLMLLMPVPGQSQLRIEIVDGVEGAMPIAVVPFAWNSTLPEPETGLAEIVSADLHRSGLFDPMPEAQMVDRPSRPTEVRFGAWRLLKVDHLIVGRVMDRADGMGRVGHRP